MVNITKFKILDSVIYKNRSLNSTISSVVRETPTMLILDNDVRIYKKTLFEVGDKYSRIYPINKRNMKSHKKDQYKHVVFS